MSIYFSSLYFQKTSILGGSVDFSVQIPGTYAGINPNDPTGAGRYFKKAQIWSGTPVAGDSVTNLKVTDTDGHLSTQEKALFPNYPDLFYLYETSVPTGCNAGLIIPSAGASAPLEIYQFDQYGNPVLKFLPAQLYLTGTFNTGNGVLGTVFNCNLFWGKWAIP